MDIPIEIENIEYDFGSWTLREQSKESLNLLVQTLNDNPTITIEISAHSDMIGDDKINMEVSQKRAQSVVDYLIEKGIDTKRLQAKGYGKSQPKKVTKNITKKHQFLKEGELLSEVYISKLQTDEQKAIANQFNRRTEFKVLSTNFGISNQKPKESNDKDKKKRKNLRY